MIVWVLVERGLTGTLNQALGVCDALGATPVIKQFTLRQPWRALSPYINLGINHGYDGDALNQPWPDVLIAGGRKAIGLALWVKRASGDKTFTVCLQDPRTHRKGFDLIAVPAHDPSRGSNVLVTAAAPNRITPGRLALARQTWEGSFAHIKSPRVAVLVGGNSKAYSLNALTTSSLGEHLKHLADKDVGLMITTSRRPSADNLSILQSTQKDTSAYERDGKSENT
mgnify:FL=1